MKKLIALLLVCVMVLGLVACGGKDDSNTLTIGTAQDINNLNPQMQNDQINNNAITLSHQALVYLKNPTEQAATGSTYGPALAKSWVTALVNHALNLFKVFYKLFICKAVTESCTCKAVGFGESTAYNKVVVFFDKLIAGCTAKVNISFVDEHNVIFV